MRFIEAGTWSEWLTPEHCWIWSLANVKEASKDARIYVGRCATLHSSCFSLIRRAWILRNQTVSIQLVPQCGVINYCVLCTVKAKNATKKKNDGIHNHSFNNYGASCWNSSQESVTKPSSALVSNLKLLRNAEQLIFILAQIKMCLALSGKLRYLLTEPASIRTPVFVLRVFDVTISVDSVIWKSQYCHCINKVIKEQ